MYAERGGFIIFVHINAWVLIVLFRWGIPFHCDYLLHGVPGRYVCFPKLDSCTGVNPQVARQSGKTSLVCSLAGELALDTYVVSPSPKGCIFSFFPSFPS
jgi:hypothetical protein